MKTCLIITQFAEHQPGFLDFSYRIKALGKRFQLTIVSNIPLHHAELQVPGAEYLVLPEGVGRIGWLRYIWNCARVIRARQPDCAVLLHSIVAPVAMLTGRVPTAVYWNEHPTHFTGKPAGFAPAKQLVRAVSRWLVFQGARKATRVMPIGEAHAEDLLAHGCDSERMRLIYMGADPMFSKAGLVSGRGSFTPLELIYIGTVSKARGRDVMLEALAIANKQRKVARMTIVGADDEQLKHCTDYAQKLGIADAVAVHGRVPGWDIPGFLSHADAGLCLWEDQPWWRFNPPTKLFEYLVAGLPVLASDICTHTQYIKNGQNGLVFEYDSGSLAQAIQALWERRAELPALKQRAFESSTPYMWENIEPVFLQSIEELVCK